MEIKLEGTAPSPAEKYKILLKAEGSLTSPMPSGSTDEGYVLSIKGSGTEKLPVLSFESPGVHTYTISQIKGSNSQCSYDETVYTMKVYVVFILIPFLKSRAATVNAVMMKRCTP